MSSVVIGLSHELSWDGLGTWWEDVGLPPPLPPYRGKRGIFNDTELDARPWRSEESQLGLRIFPS